MNVLPPRFRPATLAAAGLLLSGLVFADTSRADLLYPLNFVSHYAEIGFPGIADIADFNGDGLQDVVLISDGGGGVGIAWGHGDATFEEDVLTNLASVAFDSEALFPDLNRDGKADFVQYTGTNLIVRLGNGDATFGPPSSLAGDPAHTGGHLFAGDIDGDGWVDILVGPPEHAVIWRNHQDGTLEPFVTLAVGLTAAALQDLDGDGKLDLGGSTGAPPHLAIAHGVANGSFDPPVISAAGTALAFGDADGDGITDAVGDDGSGVAVLYFGVAPGSFMAGPVVVGYAAYGYMKLVDLDRDGRDEIFGYDGTSIALQRVHADRSVSVFQAVPSPPMSSPPRGFVDLNGDGLPDFVGCIDTINMFGAFFADGAGGVTTTPHDGVGRRPMRVALADLNGDGKLDVVTSNAGGGTVSVRLGDGAGHLGPRADYPAGTTPVGLALGDLNQDAVPDIVVADSSANAVQVLPGTGSGSFGAPLPYATGAAPYDVVLAHLDHDALLDVGTANRGGQSISILHGHADGTLGPHQDFPTGLSSRRLAFADLDGDGDLDAVTCAMTKVSVQMGDGAGALAPPTIYSFSSANSDFGPWGALALGDWNGDGKVDVVVTSVSRTSFIAGNGDGTLRAAQRLDYTIGSRDVAIGDLDQDGKLDFVQAADFALGADFAGCGSVYRGNGDGTFEPWTGYGANLGTSGVAIGDLNSDGAPDLVLSNSASDNVTILLHNGSGPVPALASISSAEALSDRVRLVWQGAPYLGAALYRRVAPEAWTFVAPVVGDASGRIFYEDIDVLAGRSYSYRLGAGQGASEIFFGDVTVKTPSGAAFALGGASPNPAHGVWSVAFSLPGTGPARLEVIDLAGRIVAAREVGRLGEGSHVLALRETNSISAGVYFLRLTRGGETKLAKVCAIR
jgi:VCBS repeat protein